MDRPEDILPYYDRRECGEDSRLERHQLERDLTLRYFEDHLPATGRILEIGAATGRYTRWLAERGYDVTAVDLSETLIRQCRKRISELGLDSRVTCLVADARDLAPVSGTDFDAVLLMGPLYHLKVAASRRQALGSAVARLKFGGVLCSALVSRLGILGQLLQAAPAWIENSAAVRSVMEQGYDPDDTRFGGFHGYYATVEEIAPLHESVGLKSLVLAGVEPAISADDASYNRLHGSQREQWLDLLYEASRSRSLVASSRHLLYIGRKTGDQDTAGHEKR